jgi:hypothetical protein
LFFLRQIADHSRAVVGLPLMWIKRLLVLILLLLSACRQPTENQQEIRVSLVADGRERTFILPAPTTIDEFLRTPRVDVQLGELDQVNPPSFTQITDGMRITISRVREETQCEQTEVPYRQTTQLNEGLAAGEQRIVQAGQNGILEICYRVTIVDGSPLSRAETNRTTIRAAQDEIVYVGPTGEIEPIPITGTLAYINNGNAWVIRGSSTSKRPLTTDGDLDGRVFSLSGDGRQLLLTRNSSNLDPATVFNQLWLIPDTTQVVEPVALVPNNILAAEWIPNRENTISYSSGTPREAAPKWLAYNDLWEMRIDPLTGESLGVREIVERSTRGLYSWWGTRFHWSPDGQQLVWVQADSIGLVDLETGELEPPLLSYAVLRPVGDWSWRATVSWSQDSALIATTAHGTPIGSELPESSPAFDLTVVSADGSFAAPLLPGVGIWSAPQLSPFIANPSSEFPQGYLAFLRARDPYNSINGEYDLVVADRDGSNARVVFGRSGIRAQQSIYQNQEFVWSPDGRQIAFIYLGNLWVVDVESEVATQLTLDGGASNPVWTR